MDRVNEPSPSLVELPGHCEGRQEGGAGNGGDAGNRRRLLPRPPHNGQAQPQPPGKTRYVKSRNGCLTCKARRRKCDELKPSCSQCLGRNLSCGGYKKNIKFVEFGKQVGSGIGTGTEPQSDAELKTVPTAIDKRPYVPLQTSSSGFSDGDGNEERTQTLLPTVTRSLGSSTSPTLSELCLRHSNSASQSAEESAGQSPSPRPAALGSSEQHMAFMDMLFPGGTTDPTERLPYRHHLSLLPNFGNTPQLLDFDQPISILDGDLDAHSLDIVTETPGTYRGIQVLNAEDRLTDDGLSSSLVDTPRGAGSRQALFPLYQQPLMPNDNPDNIATIFDQRICEVLCIKDGPAGNPWRVVVWPLAKTHATIYHAVAAMTYFQRANALPQHRVRGIRHLQTSIQRLDMERGYILPVRVALTATLALAFAETWYYPRASCGINHVRAAKRLLEAALPTAPAARADPSELRIDVNQVIPLNFLAKTWIYMDVLTRITCDRVEAIDTEFIARCANSTGTEFAAASDQVDPLMGCAGPLFPLLGRVADLVQSVRRRGAKPNSAMIVSQAVELKGCIEQWTPWPDEETGSLSSDGETLAPAASDLVQTAHSYKWAALLLLCQAVPELPSRLSFECIAQKILLLIATVPVDSKASIFHVFPLMIAGCETTDTEDRDWIRDRWRQLSSGNSSGISERCLELTSEVWLRRDSHQRQAHHGDESKANTARCGGHTVKSQLHWLSIMKEWGWEVFLG